MHSSDKLIREKCPACRAEITLGSSSLNKKIQCPKCRQAVIIPDGAFVPMEAAPNHAVHMPQATHTAHTAIRRREFHAAPEMVMPMETLPIQKRFPREEASMPNGNPPEDEKEPVVYCLCNGVLKKRIVSKEWGPAKSVCCMCAHENTGAEDV